MTSPHGCYVPTPDYLLELFNMAWVNRDQLTPDEHLAVVKAHLGLNLFTRAMQSFKAGSLDASERRGAARWYAFVAGVSAPGTERRDS